MTLAELDRIAAALEIPLTLLTKGNAVRQHMQVAARASHGMEEELRPAEGLVGRSEPSFGSSMPSSKAGT